ncbi:MAG: pancreas/duodenum homeobox protein 1 [Desulfobulbaceae bacterium]|nr:pancreas/duodenum homeobox protein 1 [Desulfobulbaceae bacterium]
MDKEKLAAIFNENVLLNLFPADKTNRFFEALFGDASDGAYDIKLGYGGFDPGKSRLQFNLELHERPGCCLACNMTYGLPQVFTRHPVINVQGLVNDILKQIGEKARCESWSLGNTMPQSKGFHLIPLFITLAQ